MKSAPEQQQQTPPKYVRTGVIAEYCSVHRDTVWDWMTTGVRIMDRVVRLRSERIGKHHKTTWEWFEEFKRECNPPEQTTAQGQTESQSAKKKRIEKDRARFEEIVGGGRRKG